METSVDTWRVVIADDEPIIREGIRDAVDWESLGLEVVAEAGDGEEALELALRHRANVLLVDINMPIMNGLTLIREVKEQLPNIRVVIVTGHDEFGYAQQAIRFGVDEYILKPANPDQLNEVLLRVKRELDRSASQESHLLMASRQIRKNIPLLRERFCNEWIEEALSEQEIVDQLQFLDLPVRPPNAFGIVRWPEVDLGQSVRSERDRQLMLFAIENICSEVLSPREHAIFRDSSGFIGAIVWGEADEQLFAEIEAHVARYLKLHIVTQCVPVEGGYADVGAAYRKARAGVYKETSISPLVRRARQYLREHYSDSQLSLESVAKAIGVSPVYLSRLFKQETGTTFVTLLTQIRISKAVQLLSTTDRSIADIGEAVGYESQHYFSTAFKKVVGVSPNRYRRGEGADE
jgi:two-component system response regulator YesN